MTNPNPMINGMIAEASFAVIAFTNQWELTQPFHHAQGYDFAIRRDGRTWETVQVKCAYLGRNGTMHAGMKRSNNRPYKLGDFDLLFAWLDSDNRWLIPWEAVSGTRSAIALTNKKGPSKRFAEFRI